MATRAVATCLMLMVALTGCFSVKSYVDPTLPKVGYGDLLARSERQPVALPVIDRHEIRPERRGKEQSVFVAGRPAQGRRQ